MSTSTNPDRPSRLVVALGIATVVLFSANLLSMISLRVWPKLQDMELFGNQDRVEEMAPMATSSMVLLKHRHNPATVSVIQTMRDRKPCLRQHDVADLQVHLEGSLDSDMQQLERQIEREMERLNSELSDMQDTIEETVSLSLQLDGDNTLTVHGQKLDLSDLESKIEGITKKFEIRVREHEAAARAKQRVIRERTQ